MINNFEQETAPLNDLERSAALKIAQSLYYFHRGADKIINSDYIIEKLTAKYPEFKRPNNKSYLNGARIRKIINYIRLNNICPNVIASSKGYYVAESVSEMQEYIESLRQRAAAINAVADALSMQIGGVA